MTVACEHSIEYFNRDSYESYERLKEKLDTLKESNLIKEEVVVSKAKKSDPLHLRLSMIILIIKEITK